MIRLCLDTSAYSYFERGDSAAVDLIDSAEWVGMPSVVVGELAIGFLSGKYTERNFEILRKFLAVPIVEELVVDHETARIYAEIFVELRRVGKPVPTNDIWIAATAIRAGATLLTYDGHFREISRLGAIVLDPPATRK